MMQMLGAGGVALLTDSSRPADADNPGGYFEYAPVKRLACDSRFLENAAGKAVKVIHALIRAIPKDRDMQVILMRRDLGEVVASQRRMLERVGAPADDLPEVRLAGILRDQLDDAARWLAVQPTVSLLEVDYGALVANPAAWAARVDSFVGGGLDRAAMAATVDPRLWRQRCPPSLREAVRPSRARWRLGCGPVR